MQVSDLDVVERTFTLTIEFEGRIHRKLRMSQRNILAWDYNFEFPVTNFRSEIIVTVYAAGQEKKNGEAFEAAFVGQAKFSILSQIECQNNSEMKLNDTFCEHPVSDFQKFYYEAPKAKYLEGDADELSKEKKNCQDWQKKLLWHDLRGDKGVLVGRIGLDVHFAQTQLGHYIRCFSSEAGRWDESQKVSLASDIGRLTWSGDGVPERQPGTHVNTHTMFETVEAVKQLWVYIERITAILHYFAAFLNRIASILTWEDFKSSFCWFLGSTIWAYIFRLQHAHVHLALFSLWGLSTNYNCRQKGSFYIQKLSPEYVVRNHVQLKCAKLFVGVLEASIQEKIYQKLNIVISYIPDYEKSHNMYPIGDVEEYVNWSSSILF